MNILGICDGHNSGVCLLRDGELIFAISEERLSRKKFACGFPYLSLKKCLEYCQLKPDDIDFIGISETSGRFPLRAFDFLYRKTNFQKQDITSFSSRIYQAYQNFIPLYPFIQKIEKTASMSILQNRLKNLGFKKANIYLIDHHTAHAYAAFLASGFIDPLVITMDAFGDGISGSVFVRDNFGLKPVHRDFYPHSIAILYGLIARYLGFAQGDEGKLTGLAAYGKPTEAINCFARWIKTEEGEINASYPFELSAIARALRFFSREEIAFAIQFQVEKVVLEFVKYYLKKFNKNELCLAGGLFANVKLNGELLELPEVKELFIFPEMGDGGLCYGCAAYLFYSQCNLTRLKEKYKMKSLFLGPPIEPEKKEFKLPTGYEVKKVSDVHLAVAELLQKGKIIARCTGRMEFGPRALGHRSIFFNASDPQIKDKVSKALHRPEFMPYAPVLIQEDAKGIISNLDKALNSARFMTVAFKTLKDMQEKYPSAVNVDGTSRAQIVSEDYSPDTFKILKAYKELTGKIALINTSFNLHGEPIVCDVEDAIRTFIQSKIDALTLDDWLIIKREV